MPQRMIIIHGYEWVDDVQGQVATNNKIVFKKDNGIDLPF